MARNLSDGAEKYDSDQFRQILAAIESAPLLSRRRLLRNQGYPRFLYKYRAVDPKNSESISRLEDVLIASQLWLSSPADFNDPFDMSARFVFEGTADMKRRRMKRLVMAHSALPTRQQRRQKERELAKKPIQQIVRDVRAAYARALQEMGVHSFAGDPRSILMWSHYAGNHGGLCLQFDIARDPGTLLRAIRVEYSDEYPVINWIDETAEQLKTSLLRKHVGWSYEGEQRIVVPGRARRYASFRPDSCTAVILGCKCLPESQNAVAAILNKRTRLGMPSLRIYRAVKHDAEYALVLKCDKPET